MTKRNVIFNEKCVKSVIPKEIADDLGLKPGDKLDFTVKKGKIIAIPVRSPAKSGELANNRVLATNEGVVNG